MGECASAMGVDLDHMDYAGLTQAIPPVYGDYIFGQAAMREVEKRFGLRAITFDEYLAHPERSRRQMGHWLRGVGGASPDQGVELHEARGLGLPSAGGCGGTPRPGVGAGHDVGGAEIPAGFLGGGGGSSVATWG